MNAQEFEQKLKALRSQYLNKQADDRDNNNEKSEIFTPLSTEEKRKKLLDNLHLLDEKLALLSSQLVELRENKAPTDKISELKQNIETLKFKHKLIEQKLEYVENGEADLLKKEKLKRQLTDLELKRCKALLSERDCSKIEQKIALKKEMLKKIK